MENTPQTQQKTTKKKTRNKPKPEPKSNLTLNAIKDLKDNYTAIKNYSPEFQKLGSVKICTLTFRGSIGSAS